MLSASPHIAYDSVPARCSVHCDINKDLMDDLTVHACRPDMENEHGPGRINARNFYQ